MWVNNIDMESKCLEKGYSILTTNLLENNSELVVRDLLNEMTLELHNHVVSCEDGTESVSLIAEETESVTLKNQRIVKSGLNGCLSAHNSEVKHVLKSLVADLYREGESLCLGVDLCGSNLLELNLGVELLDCLLDDGILLIKHIDDKLGCIESKSVGCGVICSKFRGDGRDASRGKDPIRSFAWRSVAKKVVSSTDFEAVGWVSLSQKLLEESELHGECVLNKVAFNRIEWGHVHVTVGVEVVHKLELIDVLENEITHGFSLWLREGEGSREAL